MKANELRISQARSGYGFDVVECKSFDAMTAFWAISMGAFVWGNCRNTCRGYAYGQGCGILESSDGYMHDAGSSHCT